MRVKAKNFTAENMRIRGIAESSAFYELSAQTHVTLVLCGKTNLNLL